MNKNKITDFKSSGFICELFKIFNNKTDFFIIEKKNYTLHIMQ